MSTTPTHPTAEAAPNRAASFMPGDIVTVNNPGSDYYEETGRVRYSLNSCARVDFADLISKLIAHEHLTKGEQE